MSADQSPISLAAAVDRAATTGIERARRCIDAGRVDEARGHLVRVLAHRDALVDAFDLASDADRHEEVRSHLERAARAIRLADAAHAALSRSIDDARAVIHDRQG